MKGLISRRLRRLAAASANLRFGALNPSFPHSLDHARASTVAISLRSSINKLIPSLSVVLFLCFCNSCAAQQIQGDFYQGLRSNAENAAGELAAREKSQKAARAFFEKALNSRNAYARTAAAAELLHCLYEGQEISAPLMNRLKGMAPFSWAAAFDALAAEPGRMREKALALLLSSGQPEQAFSRGVFPDEAALYALRECLSIDPEMFSPAELAAINGNIAASRSRYAEALKHFRITLEDPAVFFQYPDLINRLGRAFQYAGARDEGIRLFLDWEKNISANGISANGISANGISANGASAACASIACASAEKSGAIQFSLLFFAGRMARQHGRHDEGIVYFRRALPFAPDALQSDACIWYILDSALSSQSENFVQSLGELMPLWYDKPYFNDILDRLASGYALNRRWADIAALFPLIRDYADTASVAKYAYIIARALEEGLLPPDDGVADKAALIREYMETAYNTGNDALYYRMMSASALGKPFMEMPVQERRLRRARQRQLKQADSAALEFLTGFFSNKAAEYAPAYVNALENELTPAEKLHVAKSLSEAGLYAESMRLLSSCLNQGGVEFTREDFERYYPRPYREYVEKYARENNVEPSLLFGLIRTESAFQSRVVSRAGAVGLSQLLPATAAEMAERIRQQGGPDYTGEGAFYAPEANIHIGAVYVGYLMERMGSPLLALLAYNGGMNRVRRWRNASNHLSEDLFLESIEYRETREYGRRVLAAQAMYKALYY